MKRKTSIKSWKFLKNYRSPWNIPGMAEFLYEHDQWSVISGRYYRDFTVMNEKRMSVSEEHMPYIRSKRRAGGLPNDWDDYVRWATGTRSWKMMYNCKHQWMKALDD